MAHRRKRAWNMDSKRISHTAALRRVATLAMPTEATFQDEAKLRIMQAAESLFADRAIESVSLREIAVSSGHGNTNAVQYHFGNRDALVQAIFAWRVWQMEPVRGAALARLEEQGMLQDLPSLMRILCLPIADLTDANGRHTYAGFLSQYLLRQRPVGIRHAVDTRPDIAGAIRRIIDLIHDLGDGKSREDQDFQLGLAHLMFCNMLVLADNEGLSRGNPDGLRRYVDKGLAMATAALQAGIGR